MRMTAAFRLIVLSTSLLLHPILAQDAPTYGVDISFPIHHRVSTNYDFLPHNVNASVTTPVEFQEMPIQPLGDRQAAYVKHVDACRKRYGDKGNMCDTYEYDRILMNQRQPQSMQVKKFYAFPSLSANLSLFTISHILLFRSLIRTILTWVLRRCALPTISLNS